MVCAPTEDWSAWASAQSDQSSLCAQWVAKDPRFLHADRENSDQTGRIRVFSGCTNHFVGFVMRRLIYSFIPDRNCFYLLGQGNVVLHGGWGWVCKMTLLPYYDLILHNKWHLRCVQNDRFLTEIPVCKQYRPWSDATFCCFWSGSALFAFVLFMGL